MAAVGYCLWKLGGLQAVASTISVILVGVAALPLTKAGACQAEGRAAFFGCLRAVVGSVPGD